MLNISVEEILKITEGKIVNGNLDRIITTISLDTRKLKKGDFFIPLKGENFDGHNFIDVAIKKKAVGTMVEIDKLTSLKKDLNKKGISEFPSDFIVIKVDNTLRSLGLIAAFYRKRFKIKSIAITGSNGKTTTKELTYALLRTIFSEKEILKTEKNFNNEIGVPLVLFKLNSNVKVFVGELGINHIGEMQRLANMVQPHYGLITNIGNTHIEFLKNDKIVAKAKGELIPFIKDTLFLNFDDKYYNYFCNISKSKVIAYTLNTEINLKNINHFDYYKSLGLSGWEIGYRGETFKYNLLGEHNLYNLLAALTIVDRFNPDIKKLKKVIEEFKPIDNRGNIIKLKKGIIYLDGYNANPTSMEAMLYFLAKTEFPYKLAVLGDMMELGKKAMKHHTEVLQYAENFDFIKILTYGDIFKRVYEERMIKKDLIEPFNDIKKLSERIKEYLNKYENEIIILIKGSRKMELERLLKILE